MNGIPIRRQFGTNLLVFPLLKRAIGSRRQEVNKTVKLAKINRRRKIEDRILHFNLIELPDGGRGRNKMDERLDRWFWTVAVPR